MKLVLLVVGKTDSGPLEQLIDDFSGRIRRYVPFELETVPDIRGGGRGDPVSLKRREGTQLLRAILPHDLVWLLDANGKQYDSPGFARRLQKAMNSGPKRLVLVIGGAYGFSQVVRDRANASVSLSGMTYNHQVVRLMAVEQLYRGLSILGGHPYHNE